MRTLVTMPSPQAPPARRGLAGRGRAVGLVSMVLVLNGSTAPGCQVSETVVNDAGGADAPGDTPASRCVSTRVCVGNAVRSCDDGIVGDVLQICDGEQQCSVGRCTSLACADAERDETMLGCLFFAPDVDNVDSDDPQTSTVLLTNPGETVATVALELREHRQAWAPTASTTIQPGSAGSFVLPDRAVGWPGFGPAKAHRIVSDTPVGVTLIQSDDSSESSRSTGGTVLLPAHALGRSYLVMAYPQLPTPEILATAGGRRGAGQAVIVVTDDQTTVTVHVPPGARSGIEGGPRSNQPGDAFDLLLNEGDIYQLFSAGDEDDLSGTLITADKPVALFSGNISTSYGRTALGVHSPDLALEQMIPVSAWRRSYVAARLGPQEATCDSIFGGGSALWRIMAAEDETQVTFMTPPGVGGLPSGGLVLNGGQAAELLVSSAGSFIITGDKPIFVTQGMDCEGTLSSGVPAELLLHDYLFALPAHFDHEAVVVRRDRSPVELDGQLIGEGLFLPAGSAFEVARVRIPPCVGVPDRCLHRLKGQFGVTIRGMDVVCGYALTPHPWVRCLETNAPGCVN